MNSIARITTLIVGAGLLGACVVSEPYYQPGSSGYAPPPYSDSSYADQGGAEYDNPQIIVRATIAPPPLPYYEQPPCPEAGMLWTPGYWAYGPNGYFWVPGTWVFPPQVGVLWTPGYWGWSAGVFLYHDGYWGPRVGFYGGIHYGGGYDGEGFAGGRWVGNEFAYNRAVSNVNVNIVSNTYNQTVINNNVAVNRISYAGGAGGSRARPTPQDRLAEREPHIARTRLQTEHIRDASVNRDQLLRVNRGRPPIVAVPRPQAMPQFRQARPMPQQGRPMPQQWRPMPQQARPMPQERSSPQRRPPQERQPPRKGKPQDQKTKVREQSKNQDKNRRYR